MPLQAQSTIQPASSPGPGKPPRRITLFELFQQHRPVLSGLPGGTSQFDQTEIGFEWHCEFDLGTGPGGESSLQIHFHLLDLDLLPKPAAVLYLVAAPEGEEKKNRVPLPLENLTETHEQLNDRLAENGASIEMFERAGNFIAALTNVRAMLPVEVAWV